MKFAFHKLSILSLSLAVLAIAQPASAAYQTEVLNYNTISTLSAPTSATLSFAKFDTNLGTLTGVTISLNDSTSVVCQAFNNTAVTGNFTSFENTGVVTVLGPDGTTTATSLSTSPGSGSVSAGSEETVGQATSNFLTSGPVAATTLSDFEGVGAGSFNVTVTPNNFFSGSSDGNASVGGYTSSSGMVTITYNYTPNAVPEPASMAMVAMGLGGIVIARRFRRRNA